MKLLELLEEQQSVLTQESGDDNPADAEERFINVLRTKQLMKQAKDMQSTAKIVSPPKKRFSDHGESKIFC